jgi:hypothetical protein
MRNVHHSREALAVVVSRCGAGALSTSGRPSPSLPTTLCIERSRARPRTASRGRCLARGRARTSASAAAGWAGLHGAAGNGVRLTTIVGATGGAVDADLDPRVGGGVRARELLEVGAGPRAGASDVQLGATGVELCSVAVMQY